MISRIDKRFRIVELLKEVVGKLFNIVDIEFEASGSGAWGLGV